LIFPSFVIRRRTVTDGRAGTEVEVAALKGHPFTGPEAGACGEDDECAEARVDLVGQGFNVGPRLEVLGLPSRRLGVLHVEDSDGGAR
jgi:hypothetical protein